MGNQKKVGFSNIAAEYYQYHPQEVLLKEPQKSNNPIKLGIPKELSRLEKRVTITPQAVGILLENGFEVLVETGAGTSAKYTDQEYSDVGAKICYTSKEVFASDLVLKIAPPTLEEIGFMKKGKTVISALQISTVSAEYFKAINGKDITSLAYELLEDKVGGLPLVRAMSEIAGSTSMLIAAEYLSCMNDGKGIILGGITGVPPTKVVIIGAGTVAEYAARTAIGMGAEVKVFDNHIYKLRRLKEQMGQQNLYTSTIDNITLTDALMRADVTIGALRGENGRTPFVVSEETISRMKPNSVIIDVSIDQGGCFETSEVTNHIEPIFRKYDVIHYCVPNIASRVARTATVAISNIFTPLLMQLSGLGSVDEMIFNHKWFAKGVYTYRGGTTNKYMADKFSLPYKNLDLIIAASI